MAIYNKPKLVINQEKKMNISYALENHHKYFINKKNTVLHTIIKYKKDMLEITASIFDTEKNHYSEAKFIMYKKTGQAEYYLADQYYKKETAFFHDIWDLEEHLEKFLNHIIIKK